MKILLIDDEADIRRIAKLSLERLGGMEVLEASSGTEGLEMARRERPDAILLDMMMPGMDGPTTFDRLESDDTTATIPVLFLTAKALPSEITRLMELGARGVLLKPFDPIQLPAQVRRALERP